MIMDNFDAFRREPLDIQRERLVDSIPGDASVVTTFQLMPKLANREKVYSFHNVLTGLYPYSEKRYILPEDTEYALVDVNDPLTMQSFYRIGVSDNNMRNLFYNRKWKILDKAENIILCGKSERKDFDLYKTVDEFPTIKRPINAKGGESLELVGCNYKMKKEEGFTRLDFDLFWQSYGRSEDSYSAIILFLDENGLAVYSTRHPACYRIYPPPAWIPGSKIKEALTVILPADIAGRVSHLNISLAKD
jgi:hypothetical protein